MAKHKKSIGLARFALRLFWPGYWPERVKAYVRLAAFASVVCLVIAGFAARSAVADVKEQALVIGRQLADLKDLVGRSHRIALNGESIYVSSVTTDQSMTTVLDRFEKNCARHGADVTDEFKRAGAWNEMTPEQQAAAAKQGGVPLSAMERIGILREETLVEGTVACLVTPPDSAPKSMLDRLQAFAKSEDLADVGLLRYAYVRKTSSGRTHVVTSWTDGSFRFSALTPPVGDDAPGTDPAGIRPPGSTRLLTAEVTGVPHSIHLYDSREPAKVVLSRLDEQFSDKGWKVNRFVKDGNERAYERRGVDMLVFVDGSRDGTGVTMIRSSSSATDLR